MKISCKNERGLSSFFGEFNLVNMFISGSFFRVKTIFDFYFIFLFEKISHKIQEMNYTNSSPKYHLKL